MRQNPGIGKHFSDFFRDDEFGVPVRLRRSAVDYDEMPTVKILQQPRGGIDDQGRSADNERIRSRDRPHGSRHDAVVEHFSVQHHVRLDDPAAGTAWHSVGSNNLRQGKRLFAFRAKIAPDAAVKLEYRLTARLLMQSVDILRDHRFEFSRPFQPRQSEMASVWLRMRKKHFPLIKPIKFRRISHKKFMGNDRFGRIIVLFMIQTVPRTKIGNPALRADARAAEKDDVSALPDNLL